MGVAFLLQWAILVVTLLEVRAYPEPFRRDPGHPQWHHGTFQDQTVRKGAHSFLHSRAQVPFTVPLEVNVVLVGFMGDGGYRFHLDPERLQDHMTKSFHSHRLSCMETGELLAIEHEMSYNVFQVGQTELIAFEWTLRRAMVKSGLTRESEYGKEVPLYEIEATSVEPTFDQLYSYLFGLPADAQSNIEMDRPLPNAIFILNLDKVRMDPRTNETGDMGAAYGAKIEDLTPEEILKQESGYVYRYRYNGGASSQVWLSHGRYAVIDISAGPCTYGRLETEEGSVGHRTVPRLQHLLLPRRRTPVKPSDSKDVFCGLISAVIFSALEHVIAPDVRFETVDPTHRLLVPIIVLRNHLQYDPLQPGTNFSINVDDIRAQVKKMLQPGQEVVVVGGTHSLHEHERLAMAVAKATRGQSIHETWKDGRFHAKTMTYLDGAVLREEMRHSTDVLAAGILEVADPDLSRQFFRPLQAWQQPYNSPESTAIKSRRPRYPYAKRGSQERKENRKGVSNRKPPQPAQVAKSHGTRVVPVFVLSLAGVDSQLLMEGENLVWVSHDAVFVLQHAGDPIPLSSVSETKRREAMPNSPQRHILAGLAAVVGGLVAPYEKASVVHERPVLDWLWASGHHPFGPFSNTSSVSQLLLDTALRNAIYARVDMALKSIRESTEAVQAFASYYLRTPLGDPVKGQPEKSSAELWLDKFYKKTTTLPHPLPHEKVERLETYLDHLEEQMVQLSALLYDHRLQDALLNSTTLMQSAGFTQEYVDHMLGVERDQMQCCRVEYVTPVHSSQAFLYGGILIAGFVVYFLVIFFSSPER